MTRFPRALLVMGVVVAAMLAFGGLALAHANLVRSDPPANAVLPSPPPWVQIWFSEPVEPRVSQITVLDSSRKRVDTGVLSPAGDPKSLKVGLQPIGQGTYTVVWRVMSATDGHDTQGFFAFSVGETGSLEAPVAPGSTGGTGAVPTVPEVIARWAGLLAGALIFAGFGLTLVALRPRDLPSSGRDDASVEGLGKGLRSSLHVAIAVMAASAVASLLLQAASTGSLFEGKLSDVLLQTRFGMIWLARAGTIVLLLATAVLWKGESRGWKPWAGTMLALGLLLTFSLNSHGAAQEESGLLAVASDWLHLVAASAWIGGLFHLARVVLPRIRALDMGRLTGPKRQRKKGPGKEQAWAVASQVLPPFSTLAISSISVLFITGTYSAWLEVGSLDNLFGSLYGRTLLVKIGLSLPALFLGGLNLLRGFGGIPKERTGQGVPLPRGVWAEALIGAAVFLSVALLVGLPPAKPVSGASAEAGVVLSQRAGEASITLEVHPGAVGLNHFIMVVKDSRGQPLAGPARLILRFNYLDADLGVQQTEADRVDAGLYEGQWSFLSVAGRWDIEMVLRREGRDDVTASFPVKVQDSDAFP